MQRVCRRRCGRPRRSGHTAQEPGTQGSYAKNPAGVVWPHLPKPLPRWQGSFDDGRLRKMIELCQDAHYELSIAIFSEYAVGLHLLFKDGFSITLMFTSHQHIAHLGGEHGGVLRRQNNGWPM
jgi:hypothetical protein